MQEEKNCYLKVDSSGNIESNYEFIKVEIVGENKNVGLIQLNRPKALNALSLGLIYELCNAIKHFDANDNIGAIILTGQGKVFSAGADIFEMQNTTFTQLIKTDFASNWSAITNARKPLIGAINGLALGGGFEMALMCDIVYAGANARFGLPEVFIGTMPGAGGTQRLPRCIGKSRAMEVILTGNRITAEEAEKMGLVTRVFSYENLLPETIKLAGSIAGYSQVAVILAKESINKAYETTLEQGINFEKHLFYATFATKDRLEGMTAFIEKRLPSFINE